MDELKPEVSTGRSFSTVWIIPLVAVVIGLYLVVNAQLTKGPEITITFNSAEGLEAGKTKVRYRDVDIGIVDAVSLSDSLDEVVVTVKLDRSVGSMLRDDTRFWIVRARVGAGSVSGIGTIISGAYLQLEPGTGKAGAREFSGLEVPPLTAADAPGVRLVLYSESAGSISAGDAIVYNGYRVGRIESMSFDSEQREIRYDAFIEAPYDDLVTTSTGFWNVSGVTIDATVSGVRVSTGSLDTVLFGGVAFGDLPGLPPGEKAATGSIYKLNASYSELEQDPYKYGIHFIAAFTQSLRGLEPGASVEYRGVQIGRVERILVKELASQGMVGEGNPIPVLVLIEPGRLGIGDTEDTAQFMRKTITDGLAVGMRASLQTSSLLTGSLYISIDFYDDVEAEAQSEYQGYTVIPTVPSGLGRLEQQVSRLLDKLTNLPLEDTVANVNTALASLDGTLSSLSTTLTSVEGFVNQDSTKALTGELNLTLSELRKTLAGLSPNSPTGQSLSDSVFELNRTLSNLELLTRTLSEKPNALVFPSEHPADPIPEASRQ